MAWARPSSSQMFELMGPAEQSRVRSPRAHTRTTYVPSESAEHDAPFAALLVIEEVVTEDLVETRCSAFLAALEDHGRIVGTCKGRCLFDGVEPSNTVSHDDEAMRRHRPSAISASRKLM